MKRILIFEKMIDLIFKFLTEIAICFSKCWKFSFFYIRLNEHFFYSNFSKEFFLSNYAKKKKKKRFRHFSHVITKFFIQNASEFHKRKKIIRKFFSLHNVQFKCLISLRHFFFFDFWNATFSFFLFHRFSKSTRFFNIFSFF